MTTRTRLYIVMLSCVALGALATVAGMIWNPVLVAAVAAVGGFWILYGLAGWLTNL